MGESPKEREMRESGKKRIFRMFAQGKTPNQVAEMFASPANPTPTGVSLRQAERLFEEYLALPMSEKLRLTLMPECVCNRMHRLMDDISDLKLVDKALLGDVDEKTLAALLDIKRKIKERMAKEYAPATEDPAASEKEETRHELEATYEKIFGGPPAE